MQGKEVKDQLRSLIKEASLIDPSLERRLDEINRWVKDVRPGSLTAKKFVMLFLLQMIKDSQVWLNIRTLLSEEEQQAEFNKMTPTERYWYSYLFPKWLNEADPKFYIWRQKLMAEQFNQADDNVIRSIATQIVRCEGTWWRCYVADLSMATDLIVSGRQRKALCTQVTTVSEDFFQQKYEDWKNTLQDWKIERGLFLSYNPGRASYISQLVNILLYNSDNLSIGSYLKLT